MSGVGRLKFKGEKSKKKKRSHREKHDDGDELDALAREDPRGECAELPSPSELADAQDGCSRPRATR